MTLPLRDYLAQRRADIQASIKALRLELAEVEIAERALAVAAGVPEKPKRERGSSGSGRMTLKEMAVDVLRHYPNGLEASGILGEIEKRHGVVVQRESMSPQLSRLGQDGVLLREGFIWKLADYDWTIHPDALQNDEAPGGETPGAPEGAIYDLA